MFQIIIFLLTPPQILGRMGYTKETLGPGKTVVEGWYVQNFRILVRVLNYEIKNLGFLGKISFICSLIWLIFIEHMLYSNTALSTGNPTMSLFSYLRELMKKEMTLFFRFGLKDSPYKNILLVHMIFSMFPSVISRNLGSSLLVSQKQW